MGKTKGALSECMQQVEEERQRFGWTRRLLGRPGRRKVLPRVAWNAQVVLAAAAARRSHVVAAAAVSEVVRVLLRWALPPQPLPVL